MGPKQRERMENGHRKEPKRPAQNTHTNSDGTISKTGKRKLGTVIVYLFIFLIVASVCTQCFQNLS